MKPNQNTELLRALKTYPLTTGEIYLLLGIGRPASRINELRRKHDIETKMVAVKNRYGDISRVAKYIYHGEL